MDKCAQQQAVQARKLADVTAILAEHFEHFAVVVIPGGGGDKLGPPQWTFNGNRPMLVGAAEMMKLHIAGAVRAIDKPGGQPPTEA